MKKSIYSLRGNPVLKDRVFQKRTTWEECEAPPKSPDSFPGLKAWVHCLIVIVLMMFVPYWWGQIKGPSFRQLSTKLSEKSDTALEGHLELLEHPFFYWGKGSQFYVYLSEDGLYVLKIPRASKMRQALCDRVRYRKIKKPDLLESIHIAGRQLSRETAILVAHYGRHHDDVSCLVTLVDQLSRRSIVDLSEIPFVIQQRKELLSTTLEQSKDRKMVVQAYLELIEREKRKGFMSRDCAFWWNFGYEAGRAFRIDVGSYMQLSPKFSWMKATKPVKRWLRDHDLELLTWFEQEVEIRDRHG